MKQQLKTPYGNFASIKAASLHITRYHIVEFIRNNPHSNYPYNKNMDFHNKGNNSDGLHFVYHTIKNDLAPYKTKSKKGWGRI